MVHISQIICTLIVHLTLFNTDEVEKVNRKQGTAERLFDDKKGKGFCCWQKRGRC